ncbi:hypothetical protein BH10BAC1_BH10BAC1_14220 [soil metagenome]
MADKRSFEVILIDKIPYLHSFFCALLIVSTLILFYVAASLLSVRHQLEFKTADQMVLIFFYCFSFLLLVLPFYFFLRKKTKAVLVLNDDAIEVVSKKINYSITLNSIRHISIRDPQDSNGIEIRKLTLIITLHKNIVKRIRLVDYSQADVFANALYKYEGIKFT